MKKHHRSLSIEFKHEAARLVLDRGYSIPEASRSLDVGETALPPVGNTVEFKNPRYTNKLGDTQLAAVWIDPDFEPPQHAAYCARVLEIPTPRWTNYDPRALGVEPPAGVPATIQERAWSSPIRYTQEANLVERTPFYPGLKAYLP
jgi:hypothetical protein